MNFTLFFAIAALIVLSSCKDAGPGADGGGKSLAVSAAPAGETPFRPRALGADDTGLYAMASPWKGDESKWPYLNKTRPLSFQIRNIFVRDSKALEQNLQPIVDEIEYACRMPDKRRETLVRIDFWGRDGELPKVEAHKLPIQDFSVHRDRVANVLKKLSPVLPELQAVVLSEENSVDEAHLKRLRDLYYDIKEANPSLKVYEWLSPNTASPEVFGRVCDGRPLPADGWIVNPYGLSSEFYPAAKYAKYWFGKLSVLGSAAQYKRFLQRYALTDRPVVSVLWASSEKPSLVNPDNHWHVPALWFNAAANKWGMRLDEIAKRQYAVNRAFDVPTSFYWDGVVLNAAGVPRSSLYYIANEAGDPVIAEINRYVDDMIHGKVDEAIPDPDSWENPPAELTFASDSGTGDFSYSESFATPDFLENSTGTGLRDLVLLPCFPGLRVRAGAGRPRAEVDMFWKFGAKNLAMTAPRVVIAARKDPASNPVLFVYGSPDGVTWTGFAKSGDTYTPRPADAAKFASFKTLHVKLAIAATGGTAAKPGVELDRFTVGASRVGP